MNQLRRVFYQFHRLPGQFVITNPANKIFQGFANKLGVQDFSNLEFNIVINNDRRWGRLLLSDKGIGGGRFEK